MKKLILFTFLTLNYLLCFAQGNGQYHQMETEVDGLTRHFTLYAPENYNGSDALPLVFNFHGFGSSINSQINFTKMYEVADTANFFIVYPAGSQILLLPINANGIGWNIPFIAEAPQDDIAFIRKIINDLDSNIDFDIDHGRIYMSGLSNGGEMALYCAMILSDKIASVAAVACQMTDTMMAVLEPLRSVSVLHMQGTEDPYFPVNGNAFYPPIQSVSSFWSYYNGCDTLPFSYELEDIDPEDNSTVILYQYANCQDNHDVLFYKIIGGGHNWPGQEPNSWSGNVNHDINASGEIWNFFRNNPHPDYAFIGENNKLKHITTFPNPFSTATIIEYELNRHSTVQLTIFNYLGQQVGLIEKTQAQGKQQIIWNAEELPPGLYFLRLQAGNEVRIGKVIKR